MVGCDVGSYPFGRNHGAWRGVKGVKVGGWEAGMGTERERVVGRVTLAAVD